jgi:hypothetical protein
MMTLLYLALWWACGLVGSYIFLMMCKHNFPHTGVDGGDVFIALVFSLLGPMFLLGVFIMLLFAYIATFFNGTSIKPLLDWLNK